jgi:hypothetical protein
MATEISVVEDPEQSKLPDTAEAELLWDEYKYRHDLIWRHIIRSTLALVALVTVRYSEAFDNPSNWLIGFAFFAALIYWLITFITIDKELQLLEQVKAWHRYRQHVIFELHHERVDAKPEKRVQSPGWGHIFVKKFLNFDFPNRVFVYLVLLLLGILLMGIVDLRDSESAWWSLAPCESAEGSQ